MNYTLRINLIKEIIFVVGRNELSNPQLVKVLGILDCRLLISNGTSLLYTPYTGINNHCRIGERKITKVRVYFYILSIYLFICLFFHLEMTIRTQCFPNTTLLLHMWTLSRCDSTHLIYKLNLEKNPNMDMRGGHRVPLHDEELLAREIQFSLLFCLI